jgi:hypothetical protein
MALEDVVSNVANEARDSHGRWTSGGSDFTVTGSPTERTFLAKIVGGLQIVANWLLENIDMRDINMATIKHLLRQQVIDTSDAWLKHSAVVYLQNPLLVGRARWIAEQATANAHKLGVDPARIFVTDREQQYGLKGADGLYSEAFAPTGGASPGVVFLNANQIQAPDDFGIHLKGSNPIKNVAGLVAHETMHMKFYAFANAHPDEYAKYISPAKKMALEDGVSDYSRSYWNSVTTGRPQGDIGKVATKTTAISETLAEMSRIRLGHDRIPGDAPRGMPRTVGPQSQPSKDWTALYNAVNLHWEGLHPRPKSERPS